MKNRMLVFCLTFLAVIFLITACSSRATTSPTAPSNSSASLDGATLVQERCTVCHSKSRAESARFTAADWKTIVDSMIMKGAQLTPEEETVVVDYLATNFGQ